MNEAATTTATVTAAQLGVWLMCAMILIQGAANVMLLKSRHDSQRRSVTFEQEFVTVGRFVEFVAHNKEEVTALKTSIEKMAADGDARRRAIYERLGEMDRGLRAEMKADAAVVKGDLQGVGHQLTALSREISALNAKLK